MTEIATTIQCWQFNRTRTLATLDEFEKQTDPTHAISWQPEMGRAHAAWQFMHIAITEELFATTRLMGHEPTLGEWIDRYRGGSKPDDNIPTVAQIRETLLDSRERLIAVVSAFSVSQLETVPMGLAERGWSLRTALQVLAWHESHHQGQIHLTLNLLKNQT